MASDDDVMSQLTALTERVARLEAREPQLPPAVLDSSIEPPRRGRIVYSGVGPWAGRAVVWQMERTWDDVVRHEPEQIARTFSALSSPVRVRIVGALVEGSMTTAELTEQIDAGTSGQLFHHLKELLAAGLVNQPQRGVYALRTQHVLPLIAAMSASIDLASGSGTSAS